MAELYLFSSCGLAIIVSPRVSGLVNLSFRSNRGCWHQFYQLLIQCPDLTFISVAGFSIAGVMVRNHFCVAKSGTYQGLVGWPRGGISMWVVTGVLGVVYGL